MREPYQHLVLTPCGHCPGCQKDRVNMWSDRCMFEVMTNPRASSFVTLTYNDESLPPDKSVNRDDWVGFRMRLRKNLKRSYKYFMSSEYGESDNHRPHYHLLLFGFDCGVSDDMKALYNAWSPFGREKGFFTADYVTSGRIRYTLKYMAKEYGEEAQKYEELGLKPLFHAMSKGIGRDWFFAHAQELAVNHGYYVDGHLRPLPRYYEELLKAGFSDDLKVKRSLATSRSIMQQLFDRTGEKVALCSPRSLAWIEDVEKYLASPVRELEAKHKELIRDSKVRRF